MGRERHRHVHRYVSRDPRIRQTLFLTHPVSFLTHVPTHTVAFASYPPGELSKIHCTPDYAYGAGGFPAWGIMPNSELIFEIEVLSYA